MSKKNKIQIIGLVIVVVILIGYTAVTSFSTKPIEDVGEDDSVSIKGLTELTWNKPKNDDALEYIEEQLYIAVQSNLEPGEFAAGSSIDDMYVRKESFSQKDSEIDKLHTVSFIVDSESLEQSYRIKYQWTDKGAKIDPKNLEASIRCVQSNEIKYESFKCDNDSKENEWGYSKLLSQLPYLTSEFEIFQSPEGGKELIIDIILNEQNTAIGADEAIAAAKEGANKWIISQGDSPDNYVMQYVINSYL